jgi:hypothetical protein
MRPEFPTRSRRKGVAGVSDRMRSARGTVMAYSPLRALQGGIQRLCFCDAPLNLLHAQPLPQPELHQRIPIKQRNQPGDCEEGAEGNRLVALMSAQRDHRNPH